MKNWLLSLALVLTSLIGYLAWGNNQEVFLFQVERDILSKLISDPSSVMHPLVILPMLGQLLLLVTLFKKDPHKILLLTGLGCIGILFLVMFLVGLLSSNIKVILFALPYLIVAVITIWFNVKKTP